MNHKPKFILVILIPFLVACGLFSLPVTPFSPKTYVEGLWVPSDYTLEYMAQAGSEFSSHRIEFVPGGTVLLTNIPSEWIFEGESNTPYLYSGEGSWSLPEEVSILRDLQINVRVSQPGEDEATIKFGTVLDHLQFYPANNPEEINWVTFQKCYPHLHITDELLDPLVLALNKSKRDSLGFSPITSGDRIEVDSTIGTSDIWMHSYTDFSSHDIFFRLDNDEYIWVFEQENIRGLETWLDHDAARWEETIMLQYQTEEINGGPVNDLMIDYTGHDPRLTNRSDNWYLSNDINDVLPVIDEWKEWRMKQPPSPESLCH